jgi:hypothetical protein
MTLPSSGPLSINQINNEFGRGYNLNAYRNTLWYTDSGSSGYFSNNNISFSEFYGTRLTQPYRYGSPYMQYSRFTNTSGQVYFSISSGQPGASWSLSHYYNSAGLAALGAIDSGTLDGNGFVSRTYNLSVDSYWYPTQRTNCFSVTQDGAAIGNVCATTY